MAGALADADEVIFYQPQKVDWALDDVARQCRAPARVVSDIEAMASDLARSEGPVHILIMSNGGFGGLHAKLVEKLNC